MTNMYWGYMGASLDGRDRTSQEYMYDCYSTMFNQTANAVNLSEAHELCQQRCTMHSVNYAVAQADNKSFLNCGWRGFCLDNSPTCENGLPCKLGCDRCSGYVFDSQIGTCDLCYNYTTEDIRGKNIPWYTASDTHIYWNTQDPRYNL